MATGENQMPKTTVRAAPSPQVAEASMENTVELIIARSNRRAELQPESVRTAMESYLAPEDSDAKPWETWL